MSDPERAEIGRLIGQDTVSEQSILKWVARIVNCSRQSPEDVERATLEWIARDWGLSFGPETPTSDLEREVRRKIASDSSEYLSPAWRLACAMAGAGPPDALPPKMRLLEQAASLAVPSQSARQQLVSQWQEQCRTQGSDPLSQLKPTLEQLRRQPEKVEPALTLALVISLADGRLAVDEEKLFRNMSDCLGWDQDRTNDLMRRVNSLFWGHQVELGPKNSANIDPEADKLAALQAAEKTLGSAGTLEALVLEARERVVAGEPAPVPEPPRKKSAWQRLFGSLTGVQHYLASRLRSEEHVLLVRIVYLAILRQHSQAVAESTARQAAEAPAPAPKPAEETTLNLGVVEQSEAPRRSIKLNP
ncbi:MAG: hypothetical protein AB1758_23615 [Candidatus Eremiobacterota bacterium]